MLLLQSRVGGLLLLNPGAGEARNNDCHSKPQPLTLKGHHCMLLQSRVGGQLLLDPSAGEARRQDGSALLAMMPATNLVRPAAPAGLSRCQPCETHCFVQTKDGFTRWCATPEPGGGTGASVVLLESLGLSAGCVEQWGMGLDPCGRWAWRCRPFSLACCIHYGGSRTKAHGAAGGR